MNNYEPESSVMNFEFSKIYDFSGKTIVVTGGAGILCRQVIHALFDCGANVALLDVNHHLAQNFVKEISPIKKENKAVAIHCNVLEVQSVEEAISLILSEYGKIDALINGAGGNDPNATTNDEQPFFTLPIEAIKWVFDLNLIGSIIPSQIVGSTMAEHEEGVILNISSMNAFRPLTRIPAYSAAKAAINNFTQWLAVHMAQEYSPAIRVNAIAPGFFMTGQNQYLLTDKQTGELSERGKKIIDHTPMGRFGYPQDLVGPAIWLLSPASQFVTGVVLPVDGGFSAFSGV